MAQPQGNGRNSGTVSTSVRATQIMHINVYICKTLVRKPYWLQPIHKWAIHNGIRTFTILVSFGLMRNLLGSCDERGSFVSGGNVLRQYESIDKWLESEEERMTEKNTTDMIFHILNISPNTTVQKPLTSIWIYTFRQHVLAHTHTHKYSHCVRFFPLLSLGFCW